MAGADLHPGEVGGARHVPGGGGRGVSDADGGQRVQAQCGRMWRGGRQLSPPPAPGWRGAWPLCWTEHGQLSRT